MMRGSVTSLVRTWPSTIMRRAAAKSVILRVPRACERRLLAASGGKRQGTKWSRPMQLRSFPRARGPKPLAPDSRAFAGMNGILLCDRIPPANGCPVGLRTPEGLREFRDDCHDAWVVL